MQDYLIIYGCSIFSVFVWNRKNSKIKCSRKILFRCLSFISILLKYEMKILLINPWQFINIVKISIKVLLRIGALCLRLTFLRFSLASKNVRQLLSWKMLCSWLILDLKNRIFYFEISGSMFQPSGKCKFSLVEKFIRISSWKLYIKRLLIWTWQMHGMSQLILPKAINIYWINVIWHIRCCNCPQ